MTTAKKTAKKNDGDQASEKHGFFIRFSAEDWKAIQEVAALDDRKPGDWIIRQCRIGVRAAKATS